MIVSTYSMTFGMVGYIVKRLLSMNIYFSLKLNHHNDVNNVAIIFLLFQIYINFKNISENFIHIPF